MDKYFTISVIPYGGILLIFLMLMTSGCASLPTKPVSFSHILVKVQDQEKRGEWFVVESARHGDYIEVNASFIWPSAGSAGTHSVKWNVYQNDQLIRGGKEFKYTFMSSPFIGMLKFDTSGVQKGDIKFVCFLDGDKVGEHIIQVQ